jgi:hypothetical protein
MDCFVANAPRNDGGNTGRQIVIHRLRRPRNDDTGHPAVAMR